MPGVEGLPVKLGVLADFPQADRGAAFDWAVRLGLSEVGDRLPGPVELVRAEATGLPMPGGSEASVKAAFEELDRAGVLAILGPAVSDNALIVRPLADAAGIATMNYTGGEETRSRAGFHYQIGSLEDEPAFLVDHLLERGLRRVALIQDNTYIGRRMADFFDEACGAGGIELVFRSTLPKSGSGAERAVATARSAEPDALVSLGLWDLPRALSLSLASTSWRVPACANSALIYGHMSDEWARGWEGWTYCDTYSEANARYAGLARAAIEAGRPSSSTAAGVYDMGRLIGEALARAHPLTRDGVLAALERVKSLPAASGEEGTLMGFGREDRGALKGRFIVIRQWRDGRSEAWKP